MYSRGTDRRRVKLPPGYDGSAFRHDTGEVRLPEPDMKIHSGAEESAARRESYSRIPPRREETMAELPVLEESLPVAESEKTVEMPETAEPSFLEGVLAGLGSEEWLLFLVILLLIADGSDAWDVILLLCLLLAIREEDHGKSGKQ